MTPRRWFAVLSIASVIASLGFRLCCQPLCAASAEPARVASQPPCHQEALPGPAVAPIKDCGAGSVLLLVAEVRRALDIKDLAILPVSAPAIDQIVSSFTPPALVIDTGPPGTRRHLPLRI
jgi:hypothetical protein